MLQRTPPTSFIEPCLPTTAENPPAGPDWIHEIKHDGHRLMPARTRSAFGCSLATAMTGRLDILSSLKRF
jgi:bifunctional non-homologous end joining protein LigD